MKYDPSGYWTKVLKGGPGSGRRPEGGAASKPSKSDADFIRQVAADHGHRSISDEDVARAHAAASKYNDPQDYYDRLKEFFNN